MKLYKILVIAIVAALMVFSGCKLEEPSITSSANVQLSTETTDLFTSYVSLGNSLTAGYQSGAITEKYQKNSFVKQLAIQAGVGADFVQPLMGYPGIGAYTEDGAGVMELYGFDAAGNPIIAPVPYASVPGFNPALPYYSAEIMGYAAPYSNLGIPGIVLADLDNAISTANSLSHSGAIDAILRNPTLGNTTPIQQALMRTPSLITCWIGNNDVLGYATSGGYDPSAPSMDGPTFEYLYGVMLGKLTASGADVVVANIPDVTTIPFFTTIGPKIAASLIANSVPYPLSFQKAGDNLATGPATGSATTDDLLAGNVFVTLVGSPYASLVGTATGAWYRKIAADYGMPVGTLLAMAYPAVDTTQAFGLHPQNPIPHALVLDADEITIASDAVKAFNAAIESAAGTAGVPVVDANAFMADLADGYVVSGIDLSADFLTGGVFSLDGVHPNDLGYALIANEFINTINAEFDANVPIINITDFIKPVAAKMGKSGVIDPNVYFAIPEAFGGKIN